MVSSISTSCTLISTVEILKCIVSSILVLINLVLCSVIGRNWQNIKQNFVNMYGVNVLLSSLVFAMTAFGNSIADLNTLSQNVDQSSSQLYQVPEQFKAFQQAFYFSLLSSSSWLLLLLSYGARKEYFARRVNLMDIRRQPLELSTKCTIQNLWNGKKFRALPLIIFFWLAPTIFAIAVAAGWRCSTSQILCSQTTSTDNGMQVGCSVHWKMLTSGFIVAAVCFWFAGCIAAFCLILLTLKYHQKLRNLPETHSVIWMSNTLTPAFKGTALALVLSFTATLPLMISAALDVGLRPDNISFASGVAELLSLIHLVFQPFIFLVYFPGLKMAMRHTLTTCRCAQRTIEPATATARNRPSPIEDMNEEELERLIELNWMSAGPAEKTPQEEKKDPFEK